MTHTSADLSGFFEIFLFHVIISTKYQKVFILILRYLKKPKGVTSK